MVLATGLGQALHAKAGLSRRVLSPRHSLAIGFDMAAPRDSFPFPALTYFSERFGGRDAYLTLFRSATSCGLTCSATAIPAMPGSLTAAGSGGHPAGDDAAPARACPDLAVAGPLEIRPIDLVRTEEVERDGLVVIGDAFQTACPIPGTGVGKLLTDVDRLANVHVPAWLATPGMSRTRSRLSTAIRSRRPAMRRACASATTPAALPSRAVRSGGLGVCATASPVLQPMQHEADGRL